uniref:2'-phosphotransferase n=1 Tax=Schistosoma japonicum TaxID=6182 RepID=Q5DHP1_SCHJA|nr:SJCHGC01721 protein [Schistosoma japonicum]
MVGIFRLCSTCLPVSSSSKKQRNPVQPANKTLSKHKPLCRNEVILNLLEQFFKGELQYSIKFTVLPDGYYSLDEIVNLPEFKKENCTAEEIAEAVHSDLLLRFSTRGSKVRLKPPELNKNPDVILSKKLACILRHAAENVGMNYEPGGYLYVDKILQLKPFQGVRVEDILRVVNSNDKKRYEVSTNPENGRLKIRAFQGHSVPIDGLDITLIENPENYPNVIHGTYFRNWESIRKEGLKRMRRTHIHFAPGEIGESGVISGLRSSAEILIYIDLAKAMKDGYKFYISKNNVILCEGNSDGCLPTKYFLAAYQRYPRVQLPLTP